MSLFQAISDFFASIFRSSSPDVQKRLKLRKIDSELRALPNGIYRNGLIQPNFAETLRVLYVNTRPILKILENTIAGPDIKRNTRFEFQLITSCYSEENQQRLESLDFENRKNEAIAADMEGTPLSRVFDEQHRRLEKLVHELNSKEFIKMDQIFIKLQQLTELCKFNFTVPLKVFDPKFNSNDSEYSGNFSAVAPIALENVFLDLYFIIADFQMTMSVANAVIALAQIINIDEVTSDRQNEIVSNLKKIEYISENIFTNGVLENLIKLAKQDPEFEAKKAVYSADARQKFSSYIQEQYGSDESRIKREIKDSKIKSELAALFEDTQLLSLSGYNEDMNELLMQNSPVSFTWIMPLQILKTFYTVYYPDTLKALFNDIVIEGFFNNPSYKTEFSQNVFAAGEVGEKLQSFENSFDLKGNNSESLLRGYIRDSHKNADFTKKLASSVNSINSEAKDLIQKQVNALYSLYLEIGDLLQDSKKPACEVVSNLKVLMMSSRNRDNTDFLENNYDKWKLFFEIMRNYAIITVAEKK